MWFRVELTEKHGTFSAVSFRSNKDTGNVVKGRVDRETWDIFSSEF
jgi:hypothetical protein